MTHFVRTRHLLFVVRDSALGVVRRGAARRGPAGCGEAQLAVVQRVTLRPAVC